MATEPVILPLTKLVDKSCNGCHQEQATVELQFGTWVVSICSACQRKLVNGLLRLHTCKWCHKKFAHEPETDGMYEYCSGYCRMEYKDEKT